MADLYISAHQRSFQAPNPSFVEIGLVYELLMIAEVIQGNVHVHGIVLHIQSILNCFDLDPL